MATSHTESLRELLGVVLIASGFVPTNKPLIPVLNAIDSILVGDDHTIRKAANHLISASVSPQEADDLCAIVESHLSEDEKLVQLVNMARRWYSERQKRDDLAEDINVPCDLFTRCRFCGAVFECSDSVLTGGDV